MPEERSRTGRAGPAKKTPAAKAPATKTAAPKTATPRSETPISAPKAPASRTRKSDPAKLAVLPGEDLWTAAEVAEVRAHLLDDVKRLVPELDTVDSALHDLMVDAGNGAGQDQADVGSSSFERDQGLTIANNAREMLTQSQHALDRIADGTYGACESCGEPIGKRRLMAFPRATLCLSCKQREERR